MFKTAFILGAGLGMRLRPLTEDCPKPLLKIGGYPIITYAMDHLIKAGVDRFIINTHHRPEMYKKRFPGNQWRNTPITFRHEPVLLDTGGGLKNIEDLIEDDEAIFCYNGDIVSDISLERLVAVHRLKRPDATLALRSTGLPLNVNINENGDVCDLRHTLGNPGIKGCLFTGIYIVETSFLKNLEAGKCESIITGFLKVIKERPGSVHGVILDEGPWYDIGSIESYKKLQSIMEKK